MSAVSIHMENKDFKMGILTVTATTAAVLSTDTIITLSVAGGTAIGAAVYGAVDWMFFSSSSSPSSINTEIRKKLERRIQDYQQNTKSLKEKHLNASTCTQDEYLETIKQLKAEKNKFSLFLKSILKNAPDIQDAAVMLIKLSEDSDEVLKMSIQALQQQVVELSNQNNTLKASKKRLTNEVDFLEENLKTLNQTLIELKKSTDDERSSYEKIKQQLDSAQKSIAGFKKVITEKDRQIKALSQKNVSLQQYVFSLTRTNQENIQHVGNPPQKTDSHTTPSFF